MSKKILAAVILLSLISGSAAYIQYEDRPATFETKHFEVKIVSDYPSQGGLEAQVTVGEGEKRTMILRNDIGADLAERCRVLYRSSRTSNPSPCGELS